MDVGAAVGPGLLGRCGNAGGGSRDMALEEQEREALALTDEGGAIVHENWKVGIPVKWNSVSGDLEHGFRRSGTLVGA